MKYKSFLILSLFIFFIAGMIMPAHAQTDIFKTQSGKEVKFTCIKHASIMIEYDGRVYYFDPVTGLKPETDYTSMPRPNIIFITHEHADHFDRMAFAQLITPSTIVYSNPATA